MLASRVLVAGPALLGAVIAQQIEPSLCPNELLGLSDGCVETLDTTVTSSSQILGQQTDLDPGAIEGDTQTVPPTSFTRPPTPTATTPTETFVFPTAPYAPGTFTNCTEYSHGMPGDWSDATLLNSCKFIAHISGITISQLLQWNPSLSKNSCTVSREYRYCTSMAQPISGPLDDEGTPCLDVQDKNKVPGTVSNSNCFTYVSGRIPSEYTTCDDIAAKFHFDIDHLVELNPWLTKETCTRDLFTGLSGHYDRKYLCISTSGNPLN